jgi:hypothetical protein
MVAPTKLAGCRAILIVPVDLGRRSSAGVPEVPEEAEGQSRHARAGNAEEDDQVSQKDKIRGP